MTRSALVLPLVFAAVVAGAVSFASAQAPAAQKATATLRDAMGQTIGSATLTEVTSGVLIRLDLTAAPAGAHGFHVHTVGQCEAPMFTSAGGHFAPGGTKHGLMSPMGPHAGDLPNVHVGADGKLATEVLVHDVTLAAGAKSLLDADGSALVLHATADDYLTDPAGNAGGRIACGVVTKQ